MDIGVGDVVVYQGEGAPYSRIGLVTNIEGGDLSLKTFFGKDIIPVMFVLYKVEDLDVIDRLQRA